jgi:hypothetical protein
VQTVVIGSKLQGAGRCSAKDHVLVMVEQAAHIRRLRQDAIKRTLANALAESGQACSDHTSCSRAADPVATLIHSQFANAKHSSFN